MAEPLITEQVAGQVADVLAPVETYIRTGQGWIAVGVGVGLTLGFGGGYLFAKRRLETKYDKLAQEEIDEAREYYRAAKAATEARLKQPIEEVVEYLGYIKKEDAEVPVGAVREVVKEAVEAVAEAVVVPDNSSDWVWDQALEEKMRDDNKGFPYVICLDEWGEKNHEGYEQSCWTWYYEDEVLADERDEPVDNADELIGLNNLNRFGHGTDSRDIVLIRNEALSMEYEISRSHGKYSEEVHGFLRHNYAVERMPKRRQGFDDEQSDQ